MSLGQASPAGHQLAPLQSLSRHKAKTDPAVVQAMCGGIPWRQQQWAEAGRTLARAT
jgi:hypothetical protein